MNRSFTYPLLAGSVGLLLLLLGAASPVSEPPAQSPVPTTATPVTVTPPSPTTATPVTVGTVTRTPSPTPTPPPALTARIRRVDFTNNLEIQRDRLRVPIQLITEFDGDAIEWKDDNCDGITNKNWPVGYPRFSTVTLDIELCVRLQGVSSVIATVRGTTRLVGTDLVFEKAGVTLVDGVNKVSGLVSQPMRSPEVQNDEPMTIRWRVISDLATVDAGPSAHNIYITLQEPLAVPGLSPPAPYAIYFTVIDWTTHAARHATSAIELVDRLESDLKDRSLFRRDFNPVSGAIDHRQARLQYYTDVSPGKPLAVLLTAEHDPFACGPNYSVPMLLMTTEGRCGAWARFMLNALGIHGVAADGIHLAVASSGCHAPAQVCIMLVNRWVFDGRGTSGEPAYPYTWDEVVDAPGVAGQGNRNPPPFFWDHAIVRVGIGNQGPHYFDPSYGTGPFATLERYERASIDGFCKPVGNAAAGPYQCQKDPPGQQLEVIGAVN